MVPLPGGKKNNKINGAQENKLNEIIKGAQKKISAGIDITDENALEVLSKLVVTATECNSKLKWGGVFISLLGHAKDFLLHEENSKIGMIHKNSAKVENTVTTISTKACIGRRPNKKLRSFKNGPMHDVYHVDIANSRSDFLSAKWRKNLKARCGVNQRGFLFLTEHTFLTIADLIELFHLEDKDEQTVKSIIEKIEVKKLLNATEDELKDLIEDGMESVFKKRLKAKKENKMEVRHYGGLLSSDFNLKIFNTMDIYHADIKLHLVHVNYGFERYVSNKKMKSINDLIDQILPKSNLTLEKLKKIDLKEDFKNDFGRHIITTLNTNVTKLEAFTEHFTIVKTWKRRLDCQGRWFFSFKERFRNGVYLDKLYEIQKNDKYQKFPSSYFFMIEYYGDNRAAIFRKRDKETIHAVYSPCMLSFECDMNVEHLSKTGEPDDFLTYKKITKVNEFQDEELGKQFYPTREEKLNVNFDKIDIGMETNEKKPFKLEFSSSLMENQQLSLLERTMKKLSKFDAEQAQSLTEDDLEFIEDEENNNETQSSKDEEKNLRGNVPYGEEEHH
jgi:hypothetical protein